MLLHYMARNSFQEQESCALKEALPWSVTIRKNTTHYVFATIIILLGEEKPMCMFLNQKSVLPCSAGGGGDIHQQCNRDMSCCVLAPTKWHN